MGCTQSVFDEATFYRRKRDTTNTLESLHAEVSELTLMATVHVDDIAVTGEPHEIASFIAWLQKRFGKDKPLKVQDNNFKHVGENYEQDEDGTVSLHNWDYIDELKEVDIPEKLDVTMEADGVSTLRSINGAIAYGCLGQPHLYGATAISASHVAKDADGKNQTYEALDYANLIVRAAKEGNRQRKLRYRRLMPGIPPTTGKCTGLKLVLLTDSAFGNLGDKASQGGWIVLLMAVDPNGFFTGFCHVLDAGSKRSVRVAKSTWGAELLAATQGLERVEYIAMWFR
jgi:hypothetical protein